LLTSDYTELCRRTRERDRSLRDKVMSLEAAAAPEFKAKCLAILDEVQKTKQPIRVTRRGRPIAEVSPPAPTNNRDWIGSMKGRMEILGDIISPASDPDDWEVLRD